MIQVTLTSSSFYMYCLSVLVYETSVKTGCSPCITNALNKCKEYKNFEDAKSSCDQAKDCESFYDYWGTKVYNLCVYKSRRYYSGGFSILYTKTKGMLNGVPYTNVIGIYTIRLIN